MKLAIMVDVQNGFISERTKHVIPKIEELLKSDFFDVVFATKFINAQGSSFRKYLSWDKMSNKEEQEIPSLLIPYITKVFEKTTYTALNNEIKEFLNNNNIEEVYIFGIDTDCCVLKTAADLFDNDYRPLVLLEYSSSNGGIESHNAAEIVLRRLIGTDQIIRGSIK